MNDTHAALTLRAASVAATALRNISLLRPMLGPVNGEAHGFETVIAELRRLYQAPKPTPPRVARALTPASLPKSKPLRRPVARPKREPELELPESAWDPEPVYEASRCQAFLMEIIRRAVSDWVQYRQARKLELKALAEQAYTWLFEEEPGHPAWKDRERALFKVEDEETGQTTIEVGTRRLTSFLAICEACGLNPESVRERARETTIEQVTRTGRRIERRNSKASKETVSIESHSVVVDIDLDSLDAEEHTSSYDYYSSGYSQGGDHAW